VPTIFTHAVLPLAAGIALGRTRVPARLLVAGMLAAMLPDADVVAFKLGIAYADDFGHRGASHSLCFVALVGAAGAVTHRFFGVRAWVAAAWLSACAASHPLLDALTNGGLGVALWWPWSDARVFAPWRPIAVSPIGSGFFSARGVAVVLSELRWIWLPCAVIAATGLALRRAVSSRP
jgi:inner membrane protein